MPKRNNLTKNNKTVFPNQIALPPMASTGNPMPCTRASAPYQPPYGVPSNGMIPGQMMPGGNYNAQL